MGQAIILDGLLGSKLHGTANENSDTDRIKIVLPTKKQIIMGHKATMSHSTGGNRKNTKTDVDTRTVTLQQFVSDCINGNLYVYDAIQNKSSNKIFNKMKDNRKELIPNNTRTMKSLYHGIHNALDKRDYDNFYRQAAHVVRLAALIAFIEYEDTYTKLEDVGIMDEVRKIKNKEVSTEYAMKIASGVYDDYLICSFLDEKAPITGKKVVDKWNHWVYNIYLEVVRGKR